MKKYVIYQKKADFERLGIKFGIDPVLARLIRNKDIVTDDDIDAYLNGKLDRLHSPWLLPDAGKAVDILEDKILNKKSIRIIGDYDIDGVQSTYILYDAINKLGGVVSYAIPDRIQDGYGINENLIKKAYDDGADTILTCDNGIAAEEPIRYAKELGMTVVVTDHHEVPFTIDADGKKKQTLVPADAVVNPKILGEKNYPYTEICGAVVAWKIMTALYEKMQRPSDETLKYLENAAFATVGDVMDLKDENRIIVKYGLKAMAHTKNLGMESLIGIKGLDKNQISAYHLGFVLGPCINASGRLDNAGKSLELFLADDAQKANECAVKLNDLNETRKEMTLKGEEEAYAMAVDSGIAEDKVIILYLPDVHESLAGIVAGRVREKYYRPVFVLTKTKDGTIKGSGRSIEGYSMYEELCKVSDLMLKFGGHEMAAGITLKEECVDEFRRQLNANCTLSEEQLQEKTYIDLQMPLHYVSPGLVRELNILEPFGKGNTKPVFADRNIEFLNPKIYGKTNRVLRMTLQDIDGRRYNGVYFGDAQAMKKFVEEKKSGSIIYYPKIDDFRGQDDIQIVVSDIL